MPHGSAVRSLQMSPASIHRSAASGDNETVLSMVDLSAVHNLALIHFRCLRLGVEAMRSGVLSMEPVPWHRLLHKSEHYHRSGGLQLDLACRGGYRAGSLVGRDHLEAEDFVERQTGKLHPFDRWSGCMRCVNPQYLLTLRWPGKVATNPNQCVKRQWNCVPASATNEFQPPCPHSTCL